MSSHDAEDCSLLPPPAVSIPKRRPRQQLSLAHRFLIVFCTLSILFELTGTWPASIGAFAAAQATPTPGTTTIDDFLGMENPDQQGYHGDFERPQDIPQIGKEYSANQSTQALPSVEPAKMQADAYVLDDTFTFNQPKATKQSAKRTVAPSKAKSVAKDGKPLQFKGSDGRLSLDVPRDAIDLTDASLADGSAPVLPLNIQITQESGHYMAERSILGTYHIQVVDGQGDVVEGLKLTKPATLHYHYTQKELTRLEINPERVLLTWPDLILKAQATKTAATAFMVPMSNDEQSSTLSANITTLAASSLTASSESDLQTPVTPHVASVSGNSGNLSYGYPLTLAPGPNGFTPQLQFSYSSQSTNERHSRRAPAGALGEGWAISLGSVSKEHYSSASTAGDSDWYSLGGIGNVSDRMIYKSSGGPNGERRYYETEHISRLRALYDTTANCWKFWDTSGWYYEAGCTNDSKQFTTDTNNVKQVYRWDVNKIQAPFESTTQVKTMFITYVQDTTDSGKTVRDSGLKQIVYGFANSNAATSLSETAGVIDFSYRGPTAQSGYVTAYGNNYNCTSNPPKPTILRCDNPINYTNGVDAPKVMSTLSLTGIKSYIGNKQYAYSEYGMTYQDDPFPPGPIYDPYTLAIEYSSGHHLLTRITPSIYQNGTRIDRKPVTMGYTTGRGNTYHDPRHTNQSGTAKYDGQTYWRYLSTYLDQETGVGATITYGTAYSNTGGTPTVFASGNSGPIVDNRLNPLYCERHANDADTSKRCTGNYAHYDDYAWSTQVVTSIENHGRSSTGVNKSKVTYEYGLKAISTPKLWDNSNLQCHKVANDPTDCVTDVWIPGYNGTSTPDPDDEWMSYYHGEFRGFNAVYITSPSQDLTAQYYHTLNSWFKPESDGSNYNHGQLYQVDVFNGNKVDDAALMRRTVNEYSGVGNFSNFNTCNGQLNAIYTPCIASMLASTTWSYEAGGVNGGTPSVRNDYYYDDIDRTTGYSYADTVFHNLTKTVTSSSNAPTVTKSWTYDPKTVASNNPNIVVYHTNLVKSSQITDDTGKVWQCQDTTYDEGSGDIKAAGWPTTSTSYSDCTNKAGTALKSYAGYDKYGNVVSTVDAFGASHSSLYGTTTGTVGCTLSTSPTTLSASWNRNSYSSCNTFDSPGIHAISAQNVYKQSTSAAFDAANMYINTSNTDANGKSNTLKYTFGTSTAQVQELQPGETGTYTRQSITSSSCTDTTELPCFSISANSSLYPNAVTRKYYDSQGRLVETRTPLDATSDLVSFTVVNEETLLTFTSQPFRYPRGPAFIDPETATIDGDGVTKPVGTTTLYDVLGRIRATKGPLVGTAEEPGITCNHLSGLWSFCSLNGYYTPQGQTKNYHNVTKVDANNQKKVIYTDELGRIRFVQSYKGSNPSVITLVKETQYNALNLAMKVIVTDLDPLVGQTTTSTASTSMYDDLGRVTRVADADSGTVDFTYNEDGKVIKSVSGTRVLGTSYDLIGRTGCIQEGDSTTDGSGTCKSGGRPLIQNIYDISKLGTTGMDDFPVGKLTQTVSSTYYPDGSTATTTETFQNDQRGRTTATTLQVGVPTSWNVTTALPTYTLTQQYDNNNQPTMTQTKVGTRVGYTYSQTYDSNSGLANGLSNNGSGMANLATLSFDQHGQVSDVNYQTIDGQALANTHFTYNADMKLIGLASNWTSGSGTTGNIFNAVRTLDPVGNVTSITNTYAKVAGQSTSGGNETQIFCYNADNQLVWAGNSGSVPAGANLSCGQGAPVNTIQGAQYSNSFSYTQLGQIWQAPTNGASTTYQYLYCDTAHPHQLTGVYALGTDCAHLSNANYSAEYDAWGNISKRTYAGVTANLSYDAQDRLTQWDAGSTSLEKYVYNSAGNRILRHSTTNSGTSLTVFAFGLEEHVYASDGSSRSNLYYYRLGNRLIGSFDGTDTKFYLTDSLGSVVTTFNAVPNSAVILANQVYGPYGNVRYSSGSIGTEKGYTGKYKDALTTLQYYDTRYYDSVVGRFLSADIVEGNASGLDPYTYVSGNPTTFIDPTGMAPIDPSGEKHYQIPAPQIPRPKISFWWGIVLTIIIVGFIVVFANTTVEVEPKENMPTRLKNKVSTVKKHTDKEENFGAGYLEISDSKGTENKNPIPPTDILYAKEGSGKPHTEEQAVIWAKQILENYKGNIKLKPHEKSTTYPVITLHIYTWKEPCGTCLGKFKAWVDLLYSAVGGKAKVEIIVWTSNENTRFTKTYWNCGKYSRDENGIYDLKTFKKNGELDVDAEDGSVKITADSEEDN